MLVWLCFPHLAQLQWTDNSSKTEERRPTTDKTSQRHSFWQIPSTVIAGQTAKSQFGHNRLDAESVTNSTETWRQRGPSVPAGGPPHWPWLGVAVRPGLGVQGWEAGRTPEVGCGLPCLPHSHHWRGTPATKTWQSMEMYKVQYTTKICGIIVRSLPTSH